MTPDAPFLLGLILGAVVTLVGIVWNAIYAVRHRRGLLIAMRTIFVGLAILTATPAIALLSIPDRPLVVTIAAIGLLPTALVPIAIATRIRTPS